MIEPDLPGEAPMYAYMQLAEKYYREDRLDLAMKVVADAFERAGWQPGAWTGLYNEIVCEKDSRDASDPRQVDERLTLEIPRVAPAELHDNVRDAALEARRTIGEALRVEWQRPVTVAIFLPDAAVDFIFGSYGYVSHKTEIDKICLPYDTVRARRNAEDALTHEYAHVATFELAGQEPPEWLDEGIATYLNGELDDRQSRFVISTAARGGRMLSLRRIAGVLRSPDERKDNPAMVNAAYLLSASFVGFWIERIGIESVREALVLMGEENDAGRAIRKAAGRRLSEIERGWRESLRRS